MTELYLSQMPYGFAGVGKTFYAVSSLWDFEKDDLKRKGYWLTFGRESNRRIKMPEITLEQVKAGEYGHIRMGSPNLDSDEFAKNFGALCRWIHKKNSGKTKHVEVFIVDGMSEFDLLYETVHTAIHGDGNKYAKWDDLLAQFFSAFQILDPEEINAHIIMTARVREVRRKEVDRIGNVTRQGDGDFIPTTYMPSVRGQFKTYMPHYFNLVTYYDTKTLMQSIGGKNVRAGVHQAHMLPEDEFLVKNNWEDLWLKAGKPSILNNPTFDEILTIVKGL